MSVAAIAPGERCLFVRSDSYGDLVLFEPLLRAAVEMLGAGRVGLVMRARYRDLQPLLPAGVRFIEVDIDPYRTGPSDHAGGALSQLRREIQQFDPDVVIVSAVEETWLDLFVAATPARARRIKHGDAVTAADLRHELAEATGDEADFRIDAIVSPDGVTERQRLRHLARTVFGPSVGVDEAPKWRIPEDAARKTGLWLRKAGMDATPFAVLFPAGVSNVTIKRWPPDRFARTARTLKGKHGLSIIFAGHDREAAIVREVANEFRALGGDAQTWLGHDGGIAELAALLARASIYVGNDTGPMHLAAAVGTPTVGIFGGGHWPRFAPGGNRAIAVAHPLPCGGCNWDCIWSKAHCIDLVDVRSVEHAVDEVLDGRGGFRIEIPPALSSESLQLIKDAASKIRRDREETSSRLSSYVGWALDERRQFKLAEQARRDSESARAALQAWAHEERVLRERTETLLSDCEANSANARRSAEEERESRIRSEARLQAELARLNAEASFERQRREAAEARLLVNRLRRLFGGAR